MVLLIVFGESRPPYGWLGSPSDTPSSVVRSEGDSTALSSSGVLLTFRSPEIDILDRTRSKGPSLPALGCLGGIK